MAPRPGLSFSHIGLYVRDIAAMEGFYVGLLGFTVTDRGDLTGADGKPFQLVFLSRDPDEHHQIVLASGRPADLPFNVINQISLRADSLATLRDLWRRCGAGGMRDIVAITHGNAVSFYGRDPEGNRLEIFWDTPWYVTQPMREPVDLAQDDATLMRWLEDFARAQPGFRPRAEWRAEMAARMGVA